MTATTTSFTVPTESGSPDATLGSLTRLGIDAVSVTGLQELLERATLTLLPTLSLLVDDDLIRHTEAGYASR